MDAAGPDHDKQAIVLAGEHRLDRAPTPDHDPFASLAERQVTEQSGGRDELDDPVDPLVADPIPALRLHSDHHLAATFLHNFQPYFRCGRRLGAGGRANIEDRRPAKFRPAGRTPS